MARLPRTKQILYGEDGSANPNFIQFGSLAAASTNYTKDLNVLQSLMAFKQGWQAATIGDQSPSLEDMNGLFYLLFSQMAYVLQQGIPEWINSETYYINQFVSSSGVVYVSLVDNNTAAVSDTNSWRRLVQRQQTALAWAYFTGGSGGTAIVNSYNINGITRNGVGDYTLSFTTAMVNANYVIQGNCTSSVSGYQYYQRGAWLTEFLDPDNTSYKTTGSFRLAVGGESDQAEDCYRGYVVIYGD